MKFEKGVLIDALFFVYIQTMGYIYIFVRCKLDNGRKREYTKG